MCIGDVREDVREDGVALLTAAEINARGITRRRRNGVRANVNGKGANGPPPGGSPGSLGEGSVRITLLTEQLPLLVPRTPRTPRMKGKWGFESVSREVRPFLLHESQTRNP